MTGAEPTLKPVLHRDGTVDPASVPLPLSSSSSPRVPRATQQKRKRTVQIESVLEEEEEDDEDDDGDSSRRIRGRPRVAAKNESAADRRRTQIRLAQRAYRNRKDNAIVTLEQKVKDLEQRNQKMSKEVTRWLDAMQNQGVLTQTPQLADSFKDLASKLTTLTSDSTARKEDGHGSSSSSEGGVEVKQRPGLPSRNQTGSSSSSSDFAFSARHTAQQQVVPFDSSKSLATVATPMLANPAVLDQSQPPAAPLEIITEPSITNASYPFATFINPHWQQSPATTLHDPWAALQLPTSYAYSEVTFGRRFTRFAVEAAYRLITNPNPNPAAVNRVFGFVLHFESPATIVHRLATICRRDTQKSLNYWDSAFHQLGGAGTHYPNYDYATGGWTLPGTNTPAPAGNQGLQDVRRPQESAGYAMGPFTVQQDWTRTQKLGPNMQMLDPAFEGQFFDPEELEIYLRQRGIYIPANAASVTAFINLADFDNANLPIPSLDTTQGQAMYKYAPAMMPEVPGSSTLFHPFSAGDVAPWSQFPGQAAQMPVGQGSDVEHMQGQGNTQMPAVGTPPATVPGSTMPSYNHGNSSSPYQTAPANPSIIRVDINMDRFIYELVTRAICLARAPGIRPSDVNIALKTAAGLVVDP